MKRRSRSSSSISNISLTPSSASVGEFVVSDDLIVMIDHGSVARRRRDAEPIHGRTEQAIRANTVVGKWKNDALAGTGTAGAREDLAAADHERWAVHHRLIALSHHRNDVRRAR